MNTAIKRTLWLGLFFYGGLLALALYFFLERTVFIDIAFHTVWKMFSLLMVTQTFYWVQSELPQGMALLMLVLAIILRYKSAAAMPGTALGMLFVLWIAVLYAHPMLAFAGTFMLLFFYDKNRDRALVANTQEKLLLSAQQVPMDKLKMSWGSSFEFMLLSALDDPKAMRLITIDEDPSRQGWATDKRRSVITEWEVWDYESLPARYFQPQDTSLYQRVETDFKNLR